MACTCGVVRRAGSCSDCSGEYHTSDPYEPDILPATGVRVGSPGAQSHEETAVGGPEFFLLEHPPPSHGGAGAASRLRGRAAHVSTCNHGCHSLQARSDIGPMGTPIGRVHSVTDGWMHPCLLKHAWACLCLSTELQGSDRAHPIHLTRGALSVLRTAHAASTAPHSQQKVSSTCKHTQITRACAPCILLVERRPASCLECY